MTLSRILLFLVFFFTPLPNGKSQSGSKGGRDHFQAGGRFISGVGSWRPCFRSVAVGRATKHTVSLLLLFFLGALFSPLSILHLASPSPPQRGTFFPFRQQQQQVSNKQEKNERCRYASTYFSLFKLLRPFPTFFVQTFSSFSVFLS